MVSLQDNVVAVPAPKGGLELPTLSGIRRPQQKRPVLFIGDDDEDDTLTEQTFELGRPRSGSARHSPVPRPTVHYGTTARVLIFQ